MNERFFVISGCSGGGKSTLLAELGRRGFAVVREPGRRIVEEEILNGGDALPWVNPEAFARRAIAMAQDDLARATEMAGPLFFDRGLVDAVAALAHVTGADLIANFVNPYARTVFITPPWPEIYGQDEERQHGFQEAVAECQRLGAAYTALRCSICELPKTTVDERVRLILDKVQI